VVVTVTGVGLHNVLAFFDYEIDEPINTFFNEQGATGGVQAAGQSFEIDEPGYVFGDIYDNFLTDTLDNTNVLSLLDAPDDVSMATGFDFALAAAETAVVTFFLDVINNSAGAFFLHHFDPDSSGEGASEVFLWATLTITGGEEPPPPIGVPEPGTLALLAAALLPLALRRRSIRLARG
jgi:hypothetical protein